LLEPLQKVFGRVAIRSAYRSSEVNGLGNAMQKAGKQGYNCAENDKNFAGHIWDQRDKAGNMGAMACVVLPEFVDAFPGEGEWTKLAWWIHDHLPYHSLEFFPTNWAFNIGWRENPVRSIYSFAGWHTASGWKRNGYLLKSTQDDLESDHRAHWQGLTEHFPQAAGSPPV